MNRALIDFDIYKWLVQLKIIDESQQIPENLKKIHLDESISKQFQSGFKFKSLLKIILNLVKSSKKVSIKDTQLQNVKMTNWNNIQNILKELNLNLDDKIKNQILSGDISQIGRVLKQIHQFFIIKIEDYDQQEIELESRKESQSDVDNFNNYLVQSLSQYLELKPPQVLTLLEDNNKYLNLMLLKGIKNDFTNLQLWMTNLKEVFESHLIPFFKDDTKDLKVYTDIVKIALISNNKEIVSISIQILNQLYEQFQIQLNQDTIEILIRSIKKHQQYILKQNRNDVIDFFLKVNREQIHKFINDILKDLIPNTKHYFQFIAIIFNVLNQEFNIQELGISDSLIEFGLAQLKESKDNDFIILTTNLICEIWEKTHLSEKQQQTMPIIYQLKSQIRNNSKLISQISQSWLFTLLNIFALEQNPNAAIVYKILVFFLIEKHDDIEIRQFQLNNFRNVFEQFKGIPIQILLDPLTKQIEMRQGVSYFLNIFDFEFFNCVTNHHQMKDSTAIDFFQTFFNIYLNNPIFWKSSYDILIALMERNQNDEEFLQNIQLGQRYLQINKDQFKQELLAKITNSLLQINTNLLGDLINSQKIIVKKQGHPNQYLTKIINAFQQPKKSILKNKKSIDLETKIDEEQSDNEQYFDENIEKNIQQNIEKNIQQNIEKNIQQNNQQSNNDEENQSNDEKLKSQLEIQQLDEAVKHQNQQDYLEVQNNGIALDQYNKQIAEKQIEINNYVEKQQKVKSKPKIKEIIIDSQQDSQNENKSDNMYNLPQKKYRQNQNNSIHNNVSSNDNELIKNNYKAKQLQIKMTLKAIEEIEALKEKKLIQQVNKEIQQERKEAKFEELRKKSRLESLKNRKIIKEVNLEIDEQSKIVIQTQQKCIKNIFQILVSQQKFPGLDQKQIVTVNELLKMYQKLHLQNSQNLPLLIRKISNSQSGVNLQEFETLLIQISKNDQIPTAIRLQQIIDDIKLKYKIQEDIWKGSEVPDGYKLVQQKQLQANYDLFDSLKDQIPQSLDLAYQIVDDIIFQQFNFHILEVQTKFQNYNVLKKVNKKADIEETSKFRVNKSQEPYQNMIFQQKQKQNQEIQLLTEEKERKRKERILEIKSQLQEYKSQKEEKPLSEDNKEQKQKQFKEFKKQQAEKQKKIQEYNQKKKEIQQQQEENKKRENEQQNQAKKQQQEIFLQKQQEKLKQQFEDKIIKREDNQKKQNELQNKKQQKEEKSKQKMLLKIQNEKEKFQKEQEEKNSILQKYNENEVQNLINQYDKKLNISFQYYVKTYEPPYQQENLALRVQYLNQRDLQYFVHKIIFQNN